jgi:hypothetical protein
VRSAHDAKGAVEHHFSQVVGIASAVEKPIRNQSLLELEGCVFLNIGSNHQCHAEDKQKKRCEWYCVASWRFPLKGDSQYPTLYSKMQMPIVKGAGSRKVEIRLNAPSQYKTSAVTVTNAPPSDCGASQLLSPIASFKKRKKKKHELKGIRAWYGYIFQGPNKTVRSL